MPPKWKDALLQVARERFAGQQAEQQDAQLMAPISPSPAQLIDRSLELIVQLRPALAARPPDGAPRRLVVDLGCGDGRWLIAAAARFGWRGVGVDLNDALLARGRAAAASDGVAFVAFDATGAHLFQRAAGCWSRDFSARTISPSTPWKVAWSTTSRNFGGSA